MSIRSDFLFEQQPQQAKARCIKPRDENISEH